ncbi:MAG TPA: glycosyl hydrolase family 2, partial [Polyangia bacterium]
MKLSRLRRFAASAIATPLAARFVIVAALLAGCSTFAIGSVAHAADKPLILSDGWNLQTSAKVNADGAAISQPGFSPSDWHRISVPATVVSALVKNKVYPDPTFGMNMRQLPGATYNIASNFSSVEMDPASPFVVPWWYRKTFKVPAAWKGKTIWLKFDALNYRANIWLNGKKLGDAKDIVGAWRVFDLNATSFVVPGKENVLAVEVFAQKRADLGITFVDWNPTAPDKNMGLWRKVSLRATGPVAVRYPAVMTRLSQISDEAALTVAAVVENGSDKTVTGILRGRIEDVTFEQSVTLEPGEVKDVAFEAPKYPQLVFKKPRLWWPAQMGKPEMYEVEMAFAASRGFAPGTGTGNGALVLGVVSDSVKQSFGIRESQSSFDAQGRLSFSINNKKVLIRGGGWSSNILMREDPQRQKDELRYVLDMGLNTVRLEGKLEDEPFLEYADRNGILLMAGWCCCDHWERWKEWTPEDLEIAAASLRDQLLRLRMHPSVFTWMNGSDGPPPARVEKRYLQVAREVRWPNPVQSSATAKVAELSGPSGVKMLGPYDWVPPRYWYEDTKRGGAYGFNTETGPGPAIPPIETMRLMLPADKLWPLNEQWNYHAGGGQFSKLDIYNTALENRYGKAATLEDYTHKGQLMAYEGIRAMFEAFTRNKYTSTGVIQWMLNNAWPSVIWHL